MLKSLIKTFYAVSLLLSFSNFVMAQDGPPPPPPPAPRPLPPPPPAPVVPVAQWKPFVAEKAGFSVLLPTVPKENTQTEDGKSFFIYSSSISQHNFLVVCIDLPLGSTEPKTFYDGAVNGIKKSDKYKVVSEKPFKLGQYDGLEVMAEVEAGLTGFIQSRFLIVENRFYQLAVISMNKKVETEEGRAFLDSFKLTPPSEKKSQPNASKPNNE